MIESIITLAGFVLAWPLLSALNSDYGKSIAVLVTVYYLLAASLNMIMGFSDLISFGQAAFFAIGGYSAALTAVDLGAGLIAGAVIGIAVSCVFAFIVSTVSRALSGVYFALATMAAAQLVYLVILNAVGFTRGPLGLNLPAADKVLVPGVPLTGDSMFHITLAAGLVATVAISFFVRSGTGVRSIGVRENADLSASIGIVPARQRTISFLVAGVLASIGGSLYAFNYGVLTPSVGSLTYSALALLMVTFGGRGTILGPLIGAAVFVIVPDAIGLEGALGQVVFAIILLLVVLLLPRGVVGSIGMRGAAVGGIIGWIRSRSAKRKVAP
jgi:branched-chain amino acid transport system permease protein